MFEQQYTLIGSLEDRYKKLWVRIEEADTNGDDYHVSLWMRLAERLEAIIYRAMEKEAK